MRALTLFIVLVSTFIFVSGRGFRKGDFDTDYDDDDDEYNRDRDMIERQYEEDQKFRQNKSLFDKSPAKFDTLDNSDDSDDSDESDDDDDDYYDDYEDEDEEFDDYMEWWEEDLDDEIRNTIKANEYAGGSIGVIKNGRLVFAQGYGELAGRKIHPSTLMPISSLSKTVTAVAILQLAESGYLVLEDQVFGRDGLLRGFETLHNEIVDQRLLDITVLDLLRHSAGWDESKGPVYDPMVNKVLLARGESVIDIAKEMNVPDLLNQYDLIRFMMGRRLDFTPGNKYKYSNFGYSVLGRVVEEVTGIPYEEYVRQNILQPAGMKSTRIGQKPFDDFILLESQLSDEVNSQFIHSLIDPQLLDSTLGWYSNTYDMVRFVRCLFGRHPGCQLLRPESVHYMLERPPLDDTGYGDSWRAIGLHVTTDGAVWQDSDIYDNDVMLYHQGPRRSAIFSVLTTDFDVVNGENVTIIALMASNRYKKLRTAAERYVDVVKTWPNDMDDLMSYDLSDAELRNNKVDVYLRFGLSEHHIVTYLNALRVSGFYPTWISGFTWDGVTDFTVVSRRSERPDQLDFKVEVSSEGRKLRRRIRDWTKQGYYVDLLQTYNSFAHDERPTHLALLRKPRDEFDLQPNMVRWDLELPLEGYFAELDEAAAEKYQVVAQSVESHGHQAYVSYVFQNLPTTDLYVSYHDLTLDMLEKRVKSHAIDSYHLEYLDSYRQDSQPKFSAIFRNTPATKWLLQTDIAEDELAQQALIWHRMDYIPKVVVGYELHNHDMRYIGLWLKL